MAEVTPTRLYNLQKKMIDVLERYLDGHYTDEHGNSIPPSAAILTIGRTILKDAGITSAPLNALPVHEAPKQLPFSDHDEILGIPPEFEEDSSE